MEKSKVIVGGCSYTSGLPWPSRLFPSADVLNLARGGSSNRFISDSIVYSIDVENKPDFVFILWTGLNKLDMILPDSPAIEKLAFSNRYYGKVGHSYYVFDGGDKYNSVLVKNYKNIADPTWPVVNNLLDFCDLPVAVVAECYSRNLLPMKQVEFNNLEQYLQTSFFLQRLYNDSKFFNDISLSAVAQCCTFLDYHKIPYQFSFFCDIFSDHADTPLLQGKIDKTNINFSRIPWQKYVKLTPYEYGLKNNFIAKDNFHLTVDGMNQWADEIKQHLTKGNNHGKTI